MEPLREQQKNNQHLKKNKIKRVRHSKKKLRCPSLSVASSEARLQSDSLFFFAFFSFEIPNKSKRHTRRAELAFDILPFSLKFTFYGGFFLILESVVCAQMRACLPDRLPEVANAVLV